MNEAFRKWWQTVPTEYTDVVNEDVSKAAFEAGMLHAAEFLDRFTLIMLDCPSKNIVKGIANTMRKEAEND